MDKGNAPVFLAFLDERLRKAPVVLLFQSAEKGVLGKPRLNDDAPLIAVAAGTAHLHQRGEEPLLGARIRTQDLGVGIENDDQTDIVEVVPLRDHLGADQNVHLSAVYLGEGLFSLMLAGDTVSVYAKHLALGEPPADLLLKTLRADASRQNVDIAARGTGFRHLRLPAAVVADQRSGRLVEDGEGGAAPARAHPAAGGA